MAITLTFLNRPHKIAVICGAAPLSLGVAIFLAWLAFQWRWLPIAGIAVLYIGLAVFAAGVIALVYAALVAARTPGVSRRRISVSVLLCAGLLVANLVAAAGIIWAVIEITTRYTVFVHNASSSQLEGVHVSGGGCEAAFGSIPPRATAVRSFYIRQDGGLALRATIAGRAREQDIEGYVTNGLGGLVEVTVNPDLDMTINRPALTQLSVINRLRVVAFWMNNAPCVTS